MATDSVIVVIAGQDVTRFARVGRVRIDDILNDAPNTAALSVVMAKRFGNPETGPFAAHAFDNMAFNVAFNHAPIMLPPVIKTGNPIQIYLGSQSPGTQIFGGHITVRDQYAEFDQPEHVRYDLQCIDLTRLLNHRKVMKEYGQASATSIVLDLIATFAPRITTSHVQAGLATVQGGITFTFEEVSRALSRIAEKIGAYWFVDYQGDLHFFVGQEAGAAPDPIVPGGRFADFKITADLTQVRTRVVVEGDGGTALLTLPAGDALLPLSQTDPFSSSGGLARLGPVRGSYTGKHGGGIKTNVAGSASGGSPAVPPPDPPGAPAAALAASTTPGNLVGGPYTYAVTLELADGRRSDVGPVSNPVTITPAANPPPTNASLYNPPVAGPLRNGLDYSYATSYLDAKGGETVATPGGSVLAGGGRPVGPPSNNVTATEINGSGGLAAGYYHYTVSFLTATGETTTPAPFQFQLFSAGNGFQVSNIPVSTDARVTGRRLYRSSVSQLFGSPGLPYRKVLDINDNFTTTVTDTMADANLPGTQLPPGNTTAGSGEGAIVTVPVSADPRVTRRRLYRKDGATANYRLIAELPDNVATTYSDVLVTSGGQLAPQANTLGSGAVNVSGIALGPAGTVRRRLFRTAAGGTEQRELVSLNDNATTVFLDTVADSQLGGSPLPAQGIPAGAAGVTPPIPAGSTELPVESLAGFPAAGWAQVEEHTIRFAGTDPGTLKLIGIPAAGIGSLDADIPAGTVVETLPFLIGVSPTQQISQGDPVQLLVQADDAGAQAALAALEGGDGIIEQYIQDRRLSQAGAQARAQAELALFKAIELRLAYSTHDTKTRSGQTVHVDLPAPTSLVGDFLIQRVTLDEVSTYHGTQPRRHVEASTTRFSFDDVLQRLLMEQA